MLQNYLLVEDLVHRTRPESLQVERYVLETYFPESFHHPSGKICGEGSLHFIPCNLDSCKFAMHADAEFPEPQASQETLRLFNSREPLYGDRDAVCESGR